MDMSRRSFLAGTLAAGILTLGVSRTHPGQALGRTTAAIPEGTQTSTQANGAATWRVPGEWEPHLRTWMAFPGSHGIWGRDLGSVQRAIARTANTIADFEPVVMCVRPSDAQRARRLLSDQVQLLRMPLDDLWMRDTGPVFRVATTAAPHTSQLPPGGQVSAVGLNFNGWGGKQRHRRDRNVARRIAAFAGLPFHRAGFVAEGGGIEADGAGNIMATRSSILNRNRNPDLSHRRISRRMRRIYGADRLVWLPGVRGQDITDDHVDATSRFVAPESVLVQNPRSNRTDDYAVSARRQLRKLQRARTADGSDFDIRTLNGPRYVRSRNPDFLDSYVNFAIVNGAVVMAEFGDPRSDQIAAETLQAIFPDRHIVQINVDALHEGGGGIHCATLSEPRP